MLQFSQYLYSLFHLQLAHLHGESKKGFCFIYFLVEYMHTLTEDVGNEILVNQHISLHVLLCSSTPDENIDFNSLSSAFNVLTQPAKIWDPMFSRFVHT